MNAGLRPTSGSPLPALEEPRRWLQHLERAHALIHRATHVMELLLEPESDLRPAAAAFERTLHAIYVAFDESAAQFEAGHAAKTELAAAIAALSSAKPRDLLAPALAAAQEAAKELDAAQEPLSRTQPRPRELVDLQASKDVPALHVVSRAPIPVAVRVVVPPPPPEPPPPPLIPPTTLAGLLETAEEVRRRADARQSAHAARELAKENEKRASVGEPAETVPGFLPKIPPAIGEREHVLQRMRECFEEVAMAGMMRLPLLGDPFRSSMFIERRMLAGIDAIAALGPTAIDAVEKLVIDAPVKDGTRTFGAGMVLGCLDGRDALASAERVLRYCGAGDTETAAGFTAAMKLVPHPMLPIVMRSMLADPDPEYRAIAIEVLAYRALATPQEILGALADPSPLVVAAALPTAGLHRMREAEQAIEAALTHDELPVRQAAWTAMLLGGNTHLPLVLEREMTAGTHADAAAIAYGILVESQEAERLYERAQAAPTEAIVTAIGWAGHASSIPWLVGLLAGKSKKELKIAAAYALDRITGAGLYEDFLLDPEALDVPDVPDPDVGEPKPKPLAQIVSDPRDRPSEGAPDAMQRPATRADRWRAYWEEKRGLFNLKLRYRRGHPYTPLITLWELDAWRVTPGERRLLQRELVVRTGAYVHFDPHDFVVVQEESLKAWEPLARRSAGNAGSWARATRK